MTDFGPDGRLLPGLIDAHVHLCWDGSRDAVPHVANDHREIVLETARASAAATPEPDVTTVRDLGDHATSRSNCVSGCRRPSGPTSSQRARRSPPAAATATSSARGRGA